MTKKEKNAEKFAKDLLTLEQYLGRDLRPDELMLLALFASVVAESEDDKKEDAPNAMSWEQAEVTLTSCPLSEDTLKDLFKPMDECCCDKKEKKEMNKDKSITGFKELDDALNSIPLDELDKILKAESEKMKSSSNHEFSDAIAEAALEICGIDLKTGRPKEE